MEIKKFVLITGSSRGLGFELAKMLDKKGMKVILTGRSQVMLDNALKELSFTKGHLSFCVDLTDENALQHFIRTLIDKDVVLLSIVHNLGGKVLGDSQPLSPTVMQQSMRLNLGVALTLNEVFIPKMLKQNYGRIIHISSTASVTGQSAPGYAAAKAAINAYVKSTGRFYVKHNIMLCAVLPGAFEHEGSEWTQKKQLQPDYYQQKVQQMPLGRFAHPSEIACYIADLVCNDSIMCAGSLMEFSGGY